MCVVLLIWPGLAGIVFALLSAGGPRPEAIHCERATRTCTYRFPSLFGTDVYRDDLASLQSSGVVVNRDGTSSWRVGRPRGPLWLGDATSQKQLAELRQLAADLQAFLDDHARATFDASLATTKRTPWPWLLFVSALMLYGGLRWWRGWDSELELDPEARTIAIHRRPMFFTGPRTVKRDASTLELVGGVESRYLGWGNRTRFLRFELRDAQTGKRVFKYLAMLDKKSRPQLEAGMKALADFFGQSS